MEHTERSSLPGPSPLLPRGPEGLLMIFTTKLYTTGIWTSQNYWSIIWLVWLDVVLTLFASFAGQPLPRYNNMHTLQVKLAVCVCVCVCAARMCVSGDKCSVLVNPHLPNIHHTQVDHLALCIYIHVGSLPTH